MIMIRVKVGIWIRMTVTDFHRTRIVVHKHYNNMNLKDNLLLMQHGYHSNASP